ncbi:MAG: class II aldolase/adducin family protein [Candidatus Izemoplasma sp.]
MSKYLTETVARKEIVKVGKRLYENGFVAANDGNISVKISDHEIIVTPTGVSKGYMTEDELVKMTTSGIILGGSRPSSEVKMHLEVYKQNRNVTAVVHAHPPISTAFAVTHTPLDVPIIAEAVVLLGNVPIAPYAKPGTDEVPNSISKFVNTHNAVLLANHGLLTWGTTLDEAHFRMESAEHYCKILLYAKQIGVPQEFNERQIDELIEIRHSLGFSTGGKPKPTKQDTQKNNISKNNNSYFSI